MIHFEYNFKHYRIAFRRVENTKFLCDVSKFTELEPNEFGYLIIGSGVSSCAPGDNFCKETGRKIALTRALDDCIAGVDKSFRRAAWKAYFNRKNPNPPPETNFVRNNPPKPINSNSFKLVLQSV